MLYTDDKSKVAAESLKAQRAEDAAKLKAFWEKQKAAGVSSPVENAVPVVATPAKYTDVTTQWLEEATPNSHVVQDAQEYIKDGVTYKVDGHNVVLDYSKHEKEIAELLESKFGGELYMVPRVNNPQGVSTPDYLFRGLPYDLKTITGKGKKIMYDRISKKSTQSPNFVFDLSRSPLSGEDIRSQIKYIYESKHTGFVDTVIVLKDNEVIIIGKRKKS